jgi:hypothetical protein
MSSFSCSASIESDYEKAITSKSFHHFIFHRVQEHIFKAWFKRKCSTFSPIGEFYSQRMDNMLLRWLVISCLPAVLTIGTFAIAIATPPLAGPLCAGGCFTYPYSDIASRFPRDYYWMYPAMLLNLVYYTSWSQFTTLPQPTRKYLAISGRHLHFFRWQRSI